MRARERENKIGKNETQKERKRSIKREIERGRERERHKEREVSFGSSVSSNIIMTEINKHFSTWDSLSLTTKCN